MIGSLRVYASVCVRACVCVDCIVCTFSHVTKIKLVIDSGIMPQWQQWLEWISMFVCPFVWPCTCGWGLLFTGVCSAHGLKHFIRVCVCVCVCVFTARRPCILMPPLFFAPPPAPVLVEAAFCWRTRYEGANCYQPWHDILTPLD